MLETHVRLYVQPTFNFVGTKLAQHKVTAYHVTLAALLTGFGSGIAIALGKPITALLLLYLSATADILDGTIARITNSAHKLGAYCDLIADRMVEYAIIIGCAIAHPQYYLCYLVFCAAVMLHFSTFVVASSLFPNKAHKSIHYDASLVERAEAFVVFGLMIWLPSYIPYILWPFNLLIVCCGLSRFVRIYKYTTKIIQYQ